MENKTSNKVLIIGILIIITTFTIALLALLIQTLNIDSGMSASIIGGVLSMFGGMVGAFGAYLVASYQMNKQFEKQDANRALELRIDKLNESLGIANELIRSLNIFHEFNRMNKIDLNEILNKVNQKDNPKLLEMLEENKSNLKLLDNLIEKLEKNRIYLEVSNIDNGIYKPFNDYESYYYALAESIEKNNPNVLDIYISQERDNKYFYENFRGSVNELIYSIEVEIKKLLNL